jgi:repressor LexA
MNQSLTKRQIDMLSVIYNYIKDTGYPPTFEEMREGLGVSSNQSIVNLLDKLEQKQVIKHSESSARSIAIKPLGYKILGKPPLVAFLGVTTAGVPLDPVEISGDWRQVSPDAAILQDEVFLLKISGDSMINAGIDDGDVVLVKSEKEFISGNVVLADLGGQKTIKRFISDDRPPYIYLKPENPKYPIIPCTDKMRLVGQVISVLKENNWKSVK